MHPIRAGTFKKTRRAFGGTVKEAASDHAIMVPGANYEIGVVKKDGLYELNCDYYDRNL